MDIIEIIKQTSLNVAGLNNIIKCKWIAKQIRESKSALIFLQETDLRVNEEKDLRIFF